MQWKLSLYSPPLPGMTSYTQLIDLAAQNGLDAVEALNTMELATPDLEAAARLRRYAEEKGVRFCCVSMGMNFAQEDTWAQIAIARQYAEVAAVLGSPYLHHTIAYEFSHYEKIRDNRDLFYRRGVNAVQRIFDTAEALGLQCIYEDQGYLFNGTEGMTRFLQDVQRDVGLVADFGNIQFVDEPIEAYIPHFPGKFRHCHVKDYRRLPPTPAQLQTACPQLSKNGTLLEDCAFGTGCVDFEAAKQALLAAGFEGYISLECPPLSGWQPEELLAHNLAFLRRWLP